jgi:hypothetical protein
MADAKLRQAEREYAGQKSPENLARLLKAKKRAGEDWESVFSAEVGRHPDDCVYFDSFERLDEPMRNFLREETELRMFVYVKRGQLLRQVLGVFRFPRVDVSNLLNKDLEKVLQYKDVISDIHVEISKQCGDVFVRTVCESGLPISKLSALRCRKLTDVGVEVISSSALPLKALNLSGTSITSKSLEYLAKSGLPLERLSVQNTNIGWIEVENYKQVKTDVEVVYEYQRSGGWRTLK